MARATKIIRNFYRDSVSLMQLSSSFAKLPGVEQASAVMASANNISLLQEAGLLAESIEASANDLLIALQGEADALESALAAAESSLKQPSPSSTGSEQSRGIAPRSIEMGLGNLVDANLALISTPGEYAAAEAFKALSLGLNVMLFSDNVGLEDEIALKRFAQERDLIVMGPDCGTAIINGIPLAFANVVRRGVIGVVAASGTGLQQVTCLVDRWGGGISQAIGTGGHDLRREVGGISMLQGLKALAADPSTSVIVLISKPPSPEVAAKVLEAAGVAGKAVVVNFLGADPDQARRKNMYPAATLEDAAAAAVALADGKTPEARRASVPPLSTTLLAPRQRYVRGLYSGGTFCYEASLLLKKELGQINSNTPVEPEDRLSDVWISRNHTVIDLGDDLFTRGRPHPMIDHRLRNERLIREASDPEVAVLILDIVLGYGSHPDPAAEMIPAIQKARDLAAEAGRHLVIVGFVCGTAADPQNLSKQETALREAGVILAESNAQAVRMAASVVREVGVVGERL
ncbi:acyl-CoA synthetase FdrA [Candidatus Nitrospira nitrificans]|uniref:Putative enzyme with acyl-CoA domain n=1 Tax=Candidatus Nitrospira nitrificans TaxID=1742973 RepID=A0A0S4LH29_9BACT|nr:acyl-CoA synthetase FdrA [Candidatus Nitrospira nitrificans]CUS35880.1 putative enzyme with acyl-CoA domain [Candidatus Nitrospira nitrificans]